MLNGEPYSSKISTDDAYVICLDGAKVWADERCVRYDEIVGDFDSLGYVPDGARVYPCEKDYSDGEIGLKILIEKQVELIEIYGGTGKREDHFFCNVGLLLQAFESGVNAVFYSDYTEFFIADGKVCLKEKVGTYVSVVPITKKVHIINSEGLKYPLDNLTLHCGESRGLSNVTVANDVAFELDEGRAIIFIVRKL